jgi:hypothetical protein
MWVYVVLVLLVVACGLWLRACYVGLRPGTAPVSAQML